MSPEKQPPWWAGWMALAAMVSSCHVPGPAAPRTPLEEAGYARQTTSAEISAFLAALGQRYQAAAHLVLGVSAGGRPLDALLVSRDVDALARGEAPGTRLRILLVGSQHGTESSGAEALLLVAREALAGALTPWLEDMDLILVPNVNPDGREARRRTNANGVNISTNFVLLSEPESRALVDALLRFRPAAILDVHESAILKRQSLALQGYLTDFEAQFEVANNANVDAGLLALSRDRLLPEVIARVEAGGLPAQPYIGEITDIHQAITHGGLTLGNLRNRAGMLGAVSFLVENRLDRADGHYATARNIGVRLEKQYLSVAAFLATCRTHRREILEVTARARQTWQATPGEAPVHLRSTYALDPSAPFIPIRLRRLDTGAPETLRFTYHGAVEDREPLPIPAAYVVAAHQDAVRPILDRQHVTYRALTAPEVRRVTVQHVRSRTPIRGGRSAGTQETVLDEHRRDVELAPGALWIDLRQPARRLIPLLLDPRSNSSVFDTPALSPLVVPGEDFFVYRVE